MDRGKVNIENDAPSEFLTKEELKKHSKFKYMSEEELDEAIMSFHTIGNLIFESFFKKNQEK
jgi:hypothetical protein